MVVSSDINKVTYLCWNIKSPIVACCILLHEEMYNHSLCTLIILRQFPSLPPHYSCKYCAFEVPALRTAGAGSLDAHCLVLLFGSFGTLTV